jgi:DNA-directed RNA polymerase specialized sigma24 family protein
VRRRGGTETRGHGETSNRLSPHRAPASSSRTWALTPEAFERLLTRLDADRERAGIRYEEVRSRLIKFFQWRGVHSPEDCADETINRVARKIEEGEVILDLNHYFGGVARMLLKDMWQQEGRERAALERSPPPRETAGGVEETEPLAECFEACLRGLAASDRELIVRYYEEEKYAKIKGRRELAAALRIPINALRIRAHRIRARLEACVEGCLAAASSGV